MLYVLWAILFLVPLAGRVILDYREKQSRKKFDEEAERLMFVAIRACDCTGCIAIPKYGSPRAWNAETGKEELIYTEMDDDGRTRTIFVSRDGEDVRAFPWSEANEGMEGAL
jgi:hypothetical protein